MLCSWSCDHFLFCKRPGWYKDECRYQSLVMKPWDEQPCCSWTDVHNFLLFYYSQAAASKKRIWCFCGSYYCKVFIKWSHWHKIKLLLRQKRPNTFWFQLLKCCSMLQEFMTNKKYWFILYFTIFTEPSPAVPCPFIWHAEGTLRKYKVQSSPSSFNAVISAC